MELKKIRKELKKRGFVLYEDPSDEDDYSLYEYYERENDSVSINYVKNSKELSVYISNPTFDFNEYGGSGVNLGDGYNYELTEKLFIYCLDIQKSPYLHEIGFCQAFLEFVKWRSEKLEPILTEFGLKDESVVCPSDYGIFSLQYSFNYSDDSRRVEISLVFDPLTFEITLKAWNGRDCEDFDFLLKESDEVLEATICEFCESNGLKSLY